MPLQGASLAKSGIASAMGRRHRERHSTRKRFSFALSAQFTGRYCQGWQKAYSFRPTRTNNSGSVGEAESQQQVRTAVAAFLGTCLYRFARRLTKRTRKHVITLSKTCSAHGVEMTGTTSSKLRGTFPSIAITKKNTVTKRDELDARLSIVEASFAGAEIGSPGVSSGWTWTNMKLDYVRVYCRQLRTALVELDASESIANIDKTRAYCRELRAVLLEMNASATIPFRCDAPSCAVLRSPRTACWLNHLEGLVAAPSLLETAANNSTVARAPIPDQTVHRSDPDFPMQEARPRVSPAGLSLLRQTISLSALISAYLLYFHIDVQLQIMKLVSIFL